MSYLVIAAITKKGSHTVSVMHVLLLVFLIFYQILLETYCLYV